MRTPTTPRTRSATAWPSSSRATPGSTGAARAPRRRRSTSLATRTTRTTRTTATSRRHSHACKALFRHVLAEPAASRGRNGVEEFRREPAAAEVGLGQRGAYLALAIGGDERKHRAAEAAADHLRPVAARRD